MISSTFLFAKLQPFSLICLTFIYAPYFSFIAFCFTVCWSVIPYSAFKYFIVVFHLSIELPLNCNRRIWVGSKPRCPSFSGQLKTAACKSRKGCAFVYSRDRLFLPVLFLVPKKPVTKSAVSLRMRVCFMLLVAVGIHLPAPYYV